MTKSILIVEDDQNFGATLELEFKGLGYPTVWIKDIKQWKQAKPAVFTYALIDLRFGDHSGLDILKDVVDAQMAGRAIVLTGYGNVATAVQAMRLGAYDYLQKPMDFASILNAFEQEKTDAEVEKHPPSLAKHEREYIEYVLQSCQGNITKAAEKLGIHRQSLQRKLRKYPPRK